METTIKLDQVIILSDQEDNVKRDKASLKEFRPGYIMAFSSGAEALKTLDNENVDLVLCDSTLEDMDGCKFIRILRQKPKHKNTPVVMVTVVSNKSSVMDAIAAGCTAYILRPYSAETFHRHMLMAEQIRRFNEIESEQLHQANEMLDQGDFDDAIEEFEEITSIRDEAQRYYDMGCDYMLKQKYGKAIISFNKAVKINELFAEAYHGLSKAYKGKGDKQKAKTYLQKAAEVHAQFDRLEEAKNLFIEVLKYDSLAPNPYNTQGVKLRRKGDYPGAVHAYTRAIELTPNDENVYFNLAKAYFYMGEVKKAQKKLIGALALNEEFPEALLFHKKIFGREWTKTGEKKVAAAPKEAARAIKDV